MAHQFIEQRIKGIRDMLWAAYEAGYTMSSASKGREREIFVDSFLSNVFPPAFRFGSGEVVDWLGQQSGQLDIVVEYPFFPSIPSFSSTSPRLYLADGVAAVIEVKSDIAKQWHEVESSAKKLAPLLRSPNVKVLGNKLTRTGKKETSLLSRRIPFFAVGYTGWKTKKSLIERINNSSVDGILVIDADLYVGGPDFREGEAEGPAALWVLITSLHLAITSAIISTADPINYVFHKRRENRSG